MNHLDKYSIFSKTKEEGIDAVYNNQPRTTKEYLQLNHENFYVILNKEGKYKYYKKSGDKLLKRKGDKYVPMKHNLVKESKEIDVEGEVDNIINIMSEILDDINVTFKSMSGDMKYKDYLDKNIAYTSFRPVYEVSNKIRSKFTVVLHTVESYDDLLNLMDEMAAVIGRLKDKDWTLYDMKIGTSPSHNRPVKITYMSYDFSKPDEITGEFKMPTEEQIEDTFDLFGLKFEESEEDDENTLSVTFTSNTYDGGIYGNMDKLFDKICDVLGFFKYSYEAGRNIVYFHTEED